MTKLSTSEVILILSLTTHSLQGKPSFRLSSLSLRTRPTTPTTAPHSSLEGHRHAWKEALWTKCSSLPRFIKLAMMSSIRTSTHSRQKKTRRKKSKLSWKQILMKPIVTLSSSRRSSSLRVRTSKGSYQPTMISV
jgi:hypothetical protein